jgi:hypothetical protein
MSDESIHQQGVVLDEPLAFALLNLAIEEGLVDDEPSIGDGFVKHLLEQKYLNEKVQDALEYFVLGGKVFVPFWLPSDWKGEIFDRGVIIPLKPKLDKETVEVNSLPIDNIEGGK